MRTFLDGGEQRPEPVRLDLAVGVQEDDHVTAGVTCARKPRSRQSDTVTAYEVNVYSTNLCLWYVLVGIGVKRDDAGD